MKLDEWTQHYIKFQDCMKKQIRTLEKKENSFFVEEKTTSKEYRVQEQLSLEQLESTQEKLIIITLNTKENLSRLITAWKEVVQHEHLSFLFVNITTNEKWHVHPLHHAKISENTEKSLHVLQDAVALHQ